MSKEITAPPLANLAMQIKVEHENARHHARAAIQHAFRVGELLLEAKDLVGYGYWSDWLHAHCNLSERSAQNYMRLALNRSNPQLTADLTIDGALKALAKPRQIDIDDANVLIASETAWLPNAGQARLGLLTSIGSYEAFGVRCSERYPGFYDIAYIESLGSDLDDDGGTASLGVMRKPVSAEAIRPVLEHFMRRPEKLADIEWNDAALTDWPFPPFAAAIDAA